jgi:nucleoside-diphosphate-sugar epimerase
MSKIKILITGINGNLASTLAKRLLLSNSPLFEIYGTHLESSTNENIAEIADKIQLLKVTKAGHVDFSQMKHPPHAIIHLATNYGRTEESHEEIVESNLYFPMKVLQYAIDNNVKTFINTDTSLERYTSAYSLSKKQFLDWLKLGAGKIQVINLILENYYGPFKKQFVFDLFNKFKNEVDEIPLTLGIQRRDFIYYEDVISAFLQILSRLDKITDSYSEFQIGSGESFSIKEIIMQMKEITNNKKTQLAWGKINLRKNELMDSKADVRAMNSVFGWYPRYSLHDGLTETFKTINNTDKI